MKNSIVPFSARVRGPQKAIDGKFPESARIGLMHIVEGLVARRFVEGWGDVSREVGRIARISPSKLGFVTASEEFERILLDLPWEKAIDFCERLHGHLARPVFDGESLVLSRDEVQAFIADELRTLFQEEALAFEFTDGCVHRRGRRHSVGMIARAHLVLSDPRLAGARKHYLKAQEFFQNPQKPDFENAVKEAVCAVEAAGKALFSDAGCTTLGDLLKWLTSDTRSLVPKAVAKSIEGLYAFRSGGTGVGHGGGTGGTPTAALAEFSMSVAASSIILFADIAAEHDTDVPF